MKEMNICDGRAEVRNGLMIIEVMGRGMLVVIPM